jgi:hypothetical protein
LCACEAIMRGSIDVKVDAQGGGLGEDVAAKTTQFARIRGQRCGEVELVDYLVDAAGPVNLRHEICA